MYALARAAGRRGLAGVPPAESVESLAVLGFNLVVMYCTSPHIFHD